MTRSGSLSFRLSRAASAVERQVTLKPFVSRTWRSCRRLGLGILDQKDLGGLSQRARAHSPSPCASRRIRGAIRSRGRLTLTPPIRGRGGRHAVDHGGAFILRRRHSPRPGASRRGPALRPRPCRSGSRRLPWGQPTSQSTGTAGWPTASDLPGEVGAHLQGAGRREEQVPVARSDIDPARNGIS